VSSNGSFNLASALQSGSAYAVTVSAQPQGETCTLANASGTAGASEVSRIEVTCTPNLYNIAGTLSGLLSGTRITLQDNGGSNTTLSNDGNFSFAAPVASGESYAVTVATAAAGQTCTVTDGSGTVFASNVSNVVVSCSGDTYNVAVTVAGVIASGLVLQNNQTDSLSISSSGQYNFNIPIASGSPYAVTVFNPPLGESCTVTNGCGTVAASNVTNTLVTRTPNNYIVGHGLWSVERQHSGAAGRRQQFHDGVEQRRLQLCHNGGERLELLRDSLDAAERTDLCHHRGQRYGCGWQRD